MGEVCEEIPKPLMKIGDMPVLWHIMKLYSSYGNTEFILLLGHLSEKIRNYFKTNNDDNWKITFVETGANTTKSERLLKIKDLIKEDNFFLAYGDDLSDINIYKLLKFHEYMQSIITVSAIRPMSDFGLMEMDEEQYITDFREKPLLNHWVNGGFMVASKGIFEYLKYGELEEEVFKKLVEEKKIAAYKHKGKWKSMNTLKDNIELNGLWEKGEAFWKR
jgi:glucose-1-phosphate cytidylyltransferase